MSYKSPISVEFEDINKRIVNAVNTSIMRAAVQCRINVDQKELIKALEYDRKQYQQGEWDMFELVTSAWYGKQMYFRESGGMVYSRVSRKTMQQDAAVNEFLEMIGE